MSNAIKMAAPMSGSRLKVVLICSTQDQSLRLILEPVEHVQIIPTLPDSSISELRPDVVIVEESHVMAERCLVSLRAEPIVVIVLVDSWDFEVLRKWFGKGANFVFSMQDDSQKLLKTLQHLVDKTIVPSNAQDDTKTIDRLANAQGF
jgi:ABC-type Fe3+-hydroxamate transport system substrate-binding protein